MLAIPAQPSDGFSVKSNSFKYWALAIFVGALVPSCSELPVRYETFETRVINFDSCEVGGFPENFSTALTGGGGAVSWIVREDNTASVGHRVLVQESSDPTKYRFPLCVYDKIIARDVSAEVSYKAISGTVDEAGGIVLRYSPENYYIARANALENNVILFKTVRGKRSKIKEVPVKVTAGEWHTIGFEAKGKRLTVTFDGQVVIDRNDTTFTEPGKVGLWTKADSVSAFDNFRIDPVPDSRP
jgi:hypothetical protein